MPPSPKRSRPEPRASKRSAAPAAKKSKGKTSATVAVDPEEAANPVSDRVVVLNVGGTVVRTLESTLRSTPSKLSEWLGDGFSKLPRDEDGHPFLDCDPRNFGYILNYLRGYGLPVHSDDAIMLAEDALRFDMEALQLALALKTPRLWKFNLGPGVRADGSQFTTADTLSLLGATPMVRQLTYTITLRVDKCDSVACGVVAVEEAREDAQLFDQRNSVCYRSSGELVRYFGDDPLYCSGVTYSNTSLITIRVCFMPNGCTNASLPPPARPPTAVQEPRPAEAPVSGEPGPDGRSPVVPIPPNAQPPRAQHPESQQSQLGASPTSAGAAAAPAIAPGSGDATFADAAAQMARDDAVPYCPSPLSLPAVPIGAIVYFSKDDVQQFEARWPAPVPPLQFAVSMQGNSSVTIIESGSCPADEEPWAVPAPRGLPGQTPGYLPSPLPGGQMPSPV